MLQIELNETEEFKIRSMDSICINESKIAAPWWSNLKYALIGAWFGIVFIKAEIISWFRIQEMFRLQSFHMFGVIGSAIFVGVISVWAIKRFNIRTIDNERIILHQKKTGVAQIFGGLLFGTGWALTGACPGPLFAQIGYGSLAAFFILLAAITGTWVYGALRGYLPH